MQNNKAPGRIQDDKGLMQPETSASYYQAHLSECYYKVQEPRKAWIEDSMAKTKMETIIRNILINSLQLVKDTANAYLPRRAGFWKEI